MASAAGGQYRVGADPCRTSHYRRSYYDGHWPKAALGAGGRGSHQEALVYRDTQMTVQLSSINW